MENLGINVKLIIAQIINFALFFLIYKKFIAKPFVNFINGEKKKEEENKSKEMKEIKEAIFAIRKTLDEAHGGWKVFIMIGGAFAVIGGALGWFFEKIVK